jgi:hypothetical protein
VTVVLAAAGCAASGLAFLVVGTACLISVRRTQRVNAHKKADGSPFGTRTSFDAMVI